MTDVVGAPGKDFIHLTGDGLPVPSGFHEITYGPTPELIFGEAGDDILRGSRGNDGLNGNAGDDWLIGSAGADSLSGGTDADTVDYSESPAGVTVDLLAQTVPARQ